MTAMLNRYVAGVVCILYFFAASFLSAQSLEPLVDSQSKRVFAHKVSGHTAIKGEPLAVAKSFISANSSALGVQNFPSNFQALPLERDQYGSTQKYQQVIDGVPVHGSSLMVQMKPDGEPTYIKTKIINGFSKSLVAKVTRPSAKRLAKRFARKTSQEKLKISSPRLIVLPLGFINNEPSVNAKLAWQVVIVDTKTDGDFFGAMYFLDASSGKLLFTLPMRAELHRQSIDCASDQGAVRKINGNMYSQACDNVLPEGCGHEIDVGNPLFDGYVFGRMEGKPARGSYPNPNPIPYYPYLGTSDVDDLYDLLEVNHDYYYNNFGIDGANGQGGLAGGSLNLGITRGWANFDSGSCGSGLCPGGAGFNFSSGSVSFCLGAVVPDTVGHEYTHGVVQYSIPGGPVYLGQTGALNEATADFMGQLIEYSYTGTTDWKEKTSPHFPPIRDLANPHSIISSHTGLPYPATFYDSYLYCGSGDQYGVHANSTVLSHALYLIAEGGSSNGCEIQGVGMDVAQQILFRGWRTYFSATETFNEAYEDLNQACNDLYGATRPEYCMTVEKALQAVEMDQQGICNDPDLSEYHTPACAQTPLPGAVDPARPDLETTLLFAPDENVFSLGQEWTGVGTVRAVLCDAGAKRMDGSQIVPYNGIFTDVTVNSDGTFAAPLWSGATEGPFEIVIDRNGDWIYDPIEDRTVTFDVRRPVDGDGVCYQGENLITSEDCHDAPTDCACSIGYTCARMTSNPNGPYECRRKVKPPRFNVMMLPEPER